MGPEVGPAFQRRSRCTLFSSLGVRLAETVEPRLVPRYGPPRARAPGPQMIWVAPGSAARGERGTVDQNVAPQAPQRTSVRRFGMLYCLRGVNMNSDVPNRREIPLLRRRPGFVAWLRGTRRLAAGLSTK
eukprot:gene23925-biopygen13410